MTRGPLSLPGRVVIFDYGEVISREPSAADREAIARLAGVSGEDEAEFWKSYLAHRDALDQGTGGSVSGGSVSGGSVSGGSVRGYWRAIAADIGADWEDARVHELWAADFRSWLSVNPGTIEVIADLSAGGTRLALLSNAGRDFGSYMRHGPLGDYFEKFFVSGEMGLIKPDPAIFARALSELDVAGADAVFIDNKEDNVRGAETLGITGHVFTTPAELRSFLLSLA